MHETRGYLAIVTLITCLGSLCFLTNCNKTETTSYPPLLEQAIDLFYTENKNDAVLQLLQQDSINNEPGIIQDVITIFRAAAICELGNPEEAATLLHDIQSSRLCPRSVYYYHSIAGLTAFRLNQYDQALRIFSSLNGLEMLDTRCKALNERIMGRLMVYYVNYELAIQQFFSSLDHFNRTNLPKSAAINQKFIASVYSELGAYDEAMKLINAAEEVFMDHNDMGELFYLYIVAIKLHVQLNKTNAAQEYVDKAMNLTLDKRDGQMLSSIYMYIGRIEKLKKNYPEAKRAFEKIILIGEPYFGVERTKARALIQLARLYNELEEHDMATRNAHQALQILGDDGYHQLRYESYKELSISHLNRSPDKAITYMDSAYVNQEKYQRLSSTGIVDFLNTFFQLEEKAEQLTHLQEKQKAHRLLNYLIIAVLLLIASVFFVISRMRKKINITSSELVKKNLSQMKSEQKLSDLVQLQRNAEDSSEKQRLTADQKDFLLFSNFKEWLETDKHYLKSDLDLNTVARELGTNRSYLSKAINSQGTRFTEIVNKYRVHEVLRIFENETETHDNYTLAEIAQTAGFHTKSVFFEAFRKETGMTPHQFKEHLRYNRIAEN